MIPFIPSVTCYAEPHKKKSQLVLEAFAAGCGGRMASTTGKLEDGPAAFYGVRESFKHLWEQCKAEGRDWYYLDNSAFDCVREKQFRVARNAIQHTGMGESDGKRFKALGITIKPMREGGGDYVLACYQSDEFMRVVAGVSPYWLPKCIASMYGDVKVKYRRKGDAGFLDDLKHASVLVTWSSAAAVTATLEGVPVKVSAQSSAIHARLNRERWAGVLADQQFTLDEMASGKYAQGMV